MTFDELIEAVGRGVDAAGVAAIGGGAAVLTVVFAVRFVRHTTRPDAITGYRRSLGKVILLGLELLLAADIIRTVALAPTFRTVGVLASIVAIRTFLSWTLEVELSGEWPWRRAQGSANAPTAPR